MKTPLERLLAKVTIQGECWVWSGSRSRNGYGKIRVDGRMQQAHRVSYDMHVGPIPEGLELDHLCRNTGCVNPAHLEPVTHAENMRRSVQSSGLKEACVNGHPFDERNTYRRSENSEGKRACRACNAAAARRLRERRATRKAA